jgi:peptide/nickel transport system substrate-binding protein
VVRHRSAWSAIALALALVVGACGGDDSGGGGGTSKPTAQQEAAAVKAIDVNPAPRDQVKQGGTVRWAIDEFPAQYNYNQFNGTTAALHDVIYALMPTPMFSDEKANVTPNPDFLESAEVTSTDPQKLTYKLNPDAKWSDGTPITWKDFAAQWKALRGSKGYEIASSTGYDQIKSVEQGSDEYEAVVTFTRPFGEWRSLFSPLYPASVNDDPEKFNKAYVNDFPVTAGPFKLQKIDKTSKSITVVPDPNWWGNKPKLDSIVFRALDQEAGVNAFVNGEVDVVDIGANAAGYKRASGTSNGVVREAGGPDFRHFTINGTSPMLSDVKVRQAVAMGINREAIVKSDLTGLNWPVRTMDNHFFVNTQAGYQANAGEVGKYNPDRAKQLLDEAGWKDQGGVRQKGGKQLEIRFVIPSGVPASRQEGELTQAMLKDIGVKLDIRTVPSDDFFSKYVNTGNFDITPFSWLGTPFPISPNLSIYREPQKGADGKLSIQQNYARVGSSEIDKLMNDANAQTDVAKARDLANQADRLIWEEVHSLVMYQRPQITGVNRDLVNVGSFGFQDRRLEDMGFKQ